MAGIVALSAPPATNVPFTNPLWPLWFSRVYQMLGKDGVTTLGKTKIFDATFTNENAFQDLLNVNKGIYSTYFSTNQNILYGFACNVHRAAGTNFVVAAQLNAWAESGVSCPVFGLAVTALTQPKSSNCSLVGFEPDIANQDDTNTSTKWGINPVFKNRFDGVGSVVNGLGSNRYNYGATAMFINSGVRSSAGEFCGWNVGLDFGDLWGDQDNPPAWSALFSYAPGQTVTSGGLVWKSISGGNLNHFPAAGSAFWVQRTYAGTNNLAVGIDFSSMSIAAMARMASAIRLRTNQYFHWEESGAIGSRVNGATGNWEIVNQTAFRFGVNLATGAVVLGNAAIALGGGAAATLGTIGGSGPTTAAQNKWLTLFDNTGTAYFVPAWI